MWLLATDMRLPKEAISKELRTWSCSCVVHVHVWGGDCSVFCSSFSAIYSQSNGCLHQTWLFITSKLFQWNILLLKFMLSICGCHTFHAANLCCSHFLIPTCSWTNLTSVFDILTHFVRASYSFFFFFFGTCNTFTVMWAWWTRFELNLFHTAAVTCALHAAA